MAAFLDWFLMESGHGANSLSAWYSSNVYIRYFARKYMEIYWMRVCRSTEYKGIITHAFAIGHYVDIKDGSDEFSKKLMYFYKYGTDMDFFLSGFLDIYKTYFERDGLMFDLISLVPTHEKSGINKNMQALAEKLSIAIKMPLEQILARNRAIKGSHEISTFKER